MNFGIFLLTLYIFLVHCNFVLLMESDPSKDDGAGPSDKRNRQKQQVEMVDKFPTHLMPPSLEWIFSLLEWVAKEWPNLAKEPGILDGIPIIEKLKEKAVGTPQIEKRQNEKEVARDLANFGEYQLDKMEERNRKKEEEREERIKEGKFNPEEWEREDKAWMKKLTKAKYSNAKELSFWTILEKVINEVNNTESEITKGLADERQPEEDKNGQRRRHKNEFFFAFMVDCIYAAHMDTNGDIKYGKIAEKLRRPRTSYPNVAAHPLHKIVTKNKCAEAEVIEAVLTLMLDRFCEEQNPDNYTIDIYFYGILQRFRESGKDIIIIKKESEEAKAKAQKHFPERLPKLHNLACLVNTSIGIVRAIINKIRSPLNGLASEAQIYTKMGSGVYAVFTRAIDDLTDIRRLIYFTITKGTHYTEALNQLANNEIKEKMHKIAYKYSFFVKIRPIMYSDWDNQKNVHMIHYLALNSFGFTQQQLPHLPEELQKAYSSYIKNLVEKIVKKIAEKIVGDFHSKMEKRDEFRGDKNVPEPNELLIHHIQLNLFCVGVQEVITNRQKFENYAAFEKYYTEHLTYMNLPYDRIWPYVGHQKNTAKKILNEMGRDEGAKVKAWEVILLEGTKEMHKQICGSRKEVPPKVEVPVEEGGNLVQS